ncbi:MAG: hypothetical protein ACYDCL_17430 [Myxococcales bacterium]
MRAAAATAVFLLAFAACGGKPAEAPDSGPALTPFQFPGYDATYSAGPFTVQPGTEIVMCTFVKGQNAQDVDVSDFATQQSVGGHHLIVYTVDHSIDLPATPCIQGGQPSWVEVLGSQDAQQQVSLPPGVGFHVKASQQFVMETHYINATSSPMTVQSGFALKYATAAVTQQAHAYFFGTLNIDIPAGATWSGGSSCSPPDSVTFYSLQGHEHRHGAGETVYYLPGAGGDGGVMDGGLLYQTQQWDAPPTLLLADGGGMTIGPSDQLAVTCDWDNSAGTTALSYPQEMCYAVGLYWPGPGTMFCATGGGTDQCQCGYFGSFDTGSGGSTVQVQITLETGLTTPKGDPPSSGHPIYCDLYQATDWPSGNLQPNAGAQPWYQGDVEGVALDSPTATATVTFNDVTPGSYSAFCFEDTISGGFIPGAGDPITFPLGSVTATLGQTATTSVVLDMAIPSGG